ncbi:hypothetical protein TCAL_08919, partial [Tigriopus californicus]|eukprot:TCALIF_08919-PA protein Name:"Protein of unknown function" AED:0.12 eAED:0.46 QI:46/0/0.2/1/0/0/5/0/237
MVVVNDCEALTRSNVIITGTTMSPGFKRKEGSQSHPWALANGTRCCQRFYRANDFTHDLDWYDPESLCFGGNVIPCPSFGHYQSLCRTNLKFKEEGNCDGTLIETDDDPTCCRSDHLFQTQQCKDLKQSQDLLSTQSGGAPCKRPELRFDFDRKYNTTGHNEKDLPKRSGTPYDHHKKTTNSKCFEENQCQGKVLDIITGDVIVFDDELSNLITSFDVKNVDNFIAFNIRLDTKHVE